MAKKKAASQAEPEELFEEDYIARKIKVSPKTLYRKRKRGEIPFVRVGPFVRYTLKNYNDIVALYQRNAA